jgi:universal stress protein F
MFKSILIPVDLAHEEQLPRLVEAAILLVGSAAGSINLLYVDQSLVHQGSYPHLNDETYAEHKKDAKQRMQHLLASLIPEHLVGVCAACQGTAHDQIIEQAGILKSDAILMMAKRPGMSSYFLGSNSEKVVRHANCSVFVIRD